MADRDVGADDRRPARRPSTMSSGCGLEQLGGDRLQLGRHGPAGDDRGAAADAIERDAAVPYAEYGVVSVSV